MGDQESIVEVLKALLENQARTFEERLSKIEATREETGRLQEEGMETSILKVLGLVGVQSLLHPAVGMKESTSIVCYKLLVRSRLPGVAVSS